MRDSDKIEIWRDVIGFEGLYLVSNLGNIYSKYSKKLLKPKNNKGYYNVTLFNGGKRYYKIVHRVVAEAFIPNPNGFDEINHKDEDKTNNHADNLEWCNTKYNLNYGNRRVNAAQHTKKPILQCDLDGNVIKEWCGAIDASKELNISYKGISRCANGLRNKYKGFKWIFKVNKDENERI